MLKSWPLVKLFLSISFIRITSVIFLEVQLRVIESNQEFSRRMKFRKGCKNIFKCLVNRTIYLEYV